MKQQQRSAAAIADQEQVLAAFESEYVSCGYMYSGGIGPEFAGRESGLGFDRALAAIKALTAAGVLRRRDCVAWRYELVPAERVKLIDAHGLREKWQDKASHFYPNHPEYGEIPRVLREAQDLRRNPLLWDMPLTLMRSCWLPPPRSSAAASCLTGKPQLTR